MNNGYNMHLGRCLEQFRAHRRPDAIDHRFMWLFGSPSGPAIAFMLVQAFTVFLALIGTTLACTSPCPPAPA